MFTQTGFVTWVGVGNFTETTCFQPKALLIWMSGGSGTGYYTAGNRAQVTNSWVTHSGDEFSQFQKYDGASVFYRDTDGSTLGGGASLDATLVSFDATGFTLSCPQNVTRSFFYMALGGDTLQANTGTFALPPVGTTPDIVVTGVGFQPDFLITLGASDHEGIGALMGWGMASSPAAADQACLSNAHWIFGSRFSRFESGYCCTAYQVPTASTDSDYLCHLKSFDADGFTVGVDQNIKNDGATQHFLALKDPSTSFKVGVATQKTSAGTKAITGVGFRPGAGLFFSSPQTSPNVKNTTVGPQFSYGGTDHFKTDQASELFTSTPTSTTPYQNQRMVQGKLLRSPS